MNIQPFVDLSKFLGPAFVTALNFNAPVSSFSVPNFRAVTGPFQKLHVPRPGGTF